eukprot:356941_1
MATGFDKRLFAKSGSASLFSCTSCKLICIDIRELSCPKGHLCCASCFTKMAVKRCPNCVKTTDSTTTLQMKRSIFVERQQSQLEMKCPNYCTWRGIFGSLSRHIKDDCVFRKEVCEHCNKSFIHKEFTIHRETCSYLKVSCPLSCDPHKKWLRMKISQHLKHECPNSMIKCEHVDQGCKQKLQRHKMTDHLKFECEFRMTQCPFIQYGCQQTEQMPFRQLTKHLEEYELKHMRFQLAHVCGELNNLQHTMNDTCIEQSKQIEFLQRKLQFHGAIRTEINNDNIHQDKHKMNSLCNDCNGLLVFCGSKDGIDPSRNCVEYINIKNKTKYLLFCSRAIDDINRIYNHQYFHLSRMSRNMNKKRKSVDFTELDQINDVKEEEKQP